MSHRVRFMPRALADLNEIHDYIAPRGGATVADNYISRIHAFCMKLETFPERGTRRDDLAIGLRTLGFERRATIAFFVEGQEVWILRVLYGGQDVEGLFGDTED
jgi:toxin ParE1/3/4